MLTEIQLANWKSFGADDSARNVVPLAPVTMLVGPNASGKSNVVDALRFLQGVALGIPLGEVLRGRWEGQREVWPGIRGHVAEAARRGTAQFSINCRYELRGDRVEHKLKVNTQVDVSIDSESVYEDDRYNKDMETLIFDTDWEIPGRKMGKRPGGALRVAVGTTKANPVIHTYSSSQSLLSQIYAELPRKNNVSPWATIYPGDIIKYLGSMIFLDIHPRSMREYRPINEGPLGNSGENISPVLYALRQHPQQLLDIVDWLNELCAPQLAGIDFDKTKLREVMMFFVEKNGEKISARSVSDGTLRFLGLLVALLTCPEGTAIILEEPDAGLHPSRIRLLAEVFERTAKRRKLQIVATTHSPTLLSYLSKDVLGNVVAFGRDPQTNETVCSALRHIPHFEQLYQSKELEHLISTGWLERAL